MKLYVLLSGGFGEKVIGNLVNLPRFCRVCGAACGTCRATRSSFGDKIVGVYKIPCSLPDFLDNPEDYLPKDPPQTDVILPIGIHLDILSTVSELVEKTNAQWGNNFR
jgi:hypothetical protein